MATILQPGEYFDPATNTIWTVLTRSEPCDEPGCWHAAYYELQRTLGHAAKLAFRCMNHAPQFVVGTGQTIGGTLATGGPIPAPNGNDIDLGTYSMFVSDRDPRPAFECPECWNTGFYHGFGFNCKRGCTPGKPVLPGPSPGIFAL